jgi:hypothetical protein
MSTVVSALVVGSPIGSITSCPSTRSSIESEFDCWQLNLTVKLTPPFSSFFVSMENLDGVPQLNETLFEELCAFAAE